jgi:hypothetical protein
LDAIITNKKMFIQHILKNELTKIDDDFEFVTGKIMTTEFEKDDFKMRLFIKKCKYNS